MNNITHKFKEKEEQNRKTNIAYIVAGYPSIDFTKELLLNLDRTLIDVLEIGIPYSDPLADGKLISQASFAATENGVTTDTIFDLLISIKGKVEKPLVFLVYYNLIFAYGVDSFIEKCIKGGITGLIIPDLPYEESHSIYEKLKENNISLIPLISVTSKERISDIVSTGSGFVYAVGALGVTGTKQVNIERIRTFIKDIKSKTDLPVSLGFGIRDNSHVKKMREYADGVIVGTSIVNLTSSNNINYTIEGINEIFAEERKK